MRMGEEGGWKEEGRGGGMRREKREGRDERKRGWEIEGWKEEEREGRK